MPNRVKELESAVAQLQATVDGLREELVDANERIRALEREHETPTTANADENGDNAVPFALLDEDGADDEETEATEEPSPPEDIIVA